MSTSVLAALIVSKVNQADDQVGYELFSYIVDQTHICFLNFCLRGEQEDSALLVSSVELCFTFIAILLYISNSFYVKIVTKGPDLEIKIEDPDEGSYLE